MAQTQDTQGFLTDRHLRSTPTGNEIIFDYPLRLDTSLKMTLSLLSAYHLRSGVVLHKRCLTSQIPRGSSCSITVSVVPLPPYA